MAGALKKIGGLAEGSRIRDVHAEEISHMFFGDAFAGSMFNLFATHPPLDERIRLLEPDFDGRFPEVQPAAIGAAEAGGGTGVSPVLPSHTGETPVPPAAMALDGGSWCGESPRKRSISAMPVRWWTRYRRRCGCGSRAFFGPGGDLFAAAQPRRQSNLDPAIATAQAAACPALYRQLQQLAAAILALPRRPGCRWPI